MSLGGYGPFLVDGRGNVGIYGDFLFMLIIIGLARKYYCCVVFFPLLEIINYFLFVKQIGVENYVFRICGEKLVLFNL